MPYIGRAATNTGNVRYLDDIASGFDGSDTTFTAQVGGVSITPDQENVRIYLDGVFQHPGSGNAYTISGSTITFEEAPVANTVFSAYVVGAGSYLDDKAVSSAKLDDDAVTAAKLDDDGTGFQVGDLGVGGSLTSGDKLTVTGRARVSGGIIGDLTGDVTGDTSGSSGSTTGNAATATTLATARAINGVNFDGSAAITVTAAAGTLTGSTLASGVTASSLTSVGTLSSLTLGGDLNIPEYVKHIGDTDTFIRFIDGGIAFSCDNTTPLVLDATSGTGMAVGGDATFAGDIRNVGTGVRTIRLESTTNAQDLNLDFFNNANAIAGRITYQEGAGAFYFQPNQAGGGTALTLDWSNNATFGGLATFNKEALISGSDSSTSATYGLEIANTSSTADTIAGVIFKNYDNYGAWIRSPRTGSSQGALIFGTNTGGGIAESNITEKMRIAADSLTFKVTPTVHKAGANSELIVKSDSSTYWTSLVLNTNSSTNNYIVSDSSIVHFNNSRTSTGASMSIDNANDVVSVRKSSWQGDTGTYNDDGGMKTVVKQIGGWSSSAATWNILKQFHDQVNYGYGLMIVELFLYAPTHGSMAYSKYLCRYGYSGNASSVDLVEQGGWSGSPAPSWGSATQTSGNIYQRILSITLADFQKTVVRITTPLAVTTNSSNTVGNRVYFY